MVQFKDSTDHPFRFRWGQKRGVGGSKRNIQFYESFMIDDVNYSLYDCVYLYGMVVHEPYIGKIIKIWELPDHTKKVKILWFFRPNELQKYLVDTPLKKEVFLASGEGVGLFNINPLDRRKWFKDLPWEDRLQKADGNGTLVFIENLDPLYTSLEIEDIIYSTFKKSCTAKVIQRATFQNPNYGEAYLIFKSREAADEVVSEIDKGCLQLPTGRILVCTKGLLKVPKSSIFGHLSIDKKLQMREMNMAVSTSHCSQPNTIEYEMSMEWLLVQQKSVRAFNALHKRQDGELKELTKRLNTK